MSVDAELVLRVQGLHKTFTLHHLGGRTVVGLAGVDLDARAGEHVAIAGASGAGKSTLLKCIYRTYLPSAGRVELHDRAGGVHDLAALDDHAVAELREHEIGYVSQFLRAEPRRGVLDVVARAGMRRGMTPAAARDAAAESLSRLGIVESLWQTYPTLLSGGEKQRVNLAAGTIEPPHLLLLDEPVAALDPTNREAVLSFLDGLVAAGVAVLAVFHDADAMRRLATRVIVLRGGQVIDEGTPVEVFAASGAGT